MAEAGMAPREVFGLPEEPFYCGAMPNRIIRESCRTSPTLAKLSSDAERLFWRLTTFADDFGRFPAEPSIVRGACFPLQAIYSTGRTKKLINELHANNLIQLYQVGDHAYGVFLTWERHQQRRAKVSKYPQPPADANICEHMRADVPVFEESRNRIRGIVFEESDATRLDDFETFWTTYPKKTGKGAARKAWVRQTANGLPPLDALLRSLDAHKQSVPWEKDDGQYIPNPATWLNQERWNDEPTPKWRPSDDGADRERVRNSIETTGRYVPDEAEPT